MCTAIGTASSPAPTLGPLDPGPECRPPSSAMSACGADVVSSSPRPPRRFVAQCARASPQPHAGMHCQQESFSHPFSNVHCPFKRLPEPEVFSTERSTRVWTAPVLRSSSNTLGAAEPGPKASIPAILAHLGRPASITTRDRGHASPESWVTPRRWRSRQNVPDPRSAAALRTVRVRGSVRPDGNRQSRRRIARARRTRWPSLAGEPTPPRRVGFLASVGEMLAATSIRFAPWRASPLP